jgi:PKD repeat protein
MRNLFRALALILSLLFGGFAAAQQSVTLQQGLNGYTGTIDSKIASSTPTTNKGADTVNSLIADTSTALLVRFAIFQSEGGPLPNNASIVSATLSLYKPWGPDAVFKANRVLKNWTELGVTWTQTGTGVNWATPGVFAGDILATADGQGSVAAQPPVQNTGCDVDTGWPDTCWLNIDVTAGVQAFVTGAPNFGWKLSFVSGSSTSTPKDFYAKEITCCNREVRRPKLTISYRTPPNASFTTTPSSGAAPLGVTFNASATTDGGSPITNLRLQFGDGTPDVSWSDKNVTQSHTYASAATYTATLTATNAIGTSAPATRTITVTPGVSGTPPTASFTATPSSGTAPLAVTFNASGSADGSSAITSLTLQFGDGQQVTWSNKAVTQSHTYTNPGTYTATLTATNASGTSAPATRAITANGAGACIPSTLPASGVAVATFHSMGLYYNPASAPSGNQIFVRYRKASDDPNVVGWTQGHPLWYDSRAVHSYNGRGSVVHLQPGTQYIFEVGTGADYATASWTNHIPGAQGEAVEPCPSTWSESFPVGTTLTPWTGTNSSTTGSAFLGSRSGSSRNHVLLANQSGTASGYTVYDFTGANAVAQTSNASGYYPVVISGSYIILKGLKTVGGEAGIFIDPGSHDIVIDGVEVTSYGRDCGTALGSGLSGNQACNEDAGIKFPDSSYGPILNTKRIVIQRSKIHNPAFGSNPWDTGHPSGTAPITMYPTGGQIVIRYNAAYSSTDGAVGGPADLSHYHQDGLVMGGCNDNSGSCASQGMGIGPDVDIYKNIVMNYFDDGLETDGDSTNTRVWKNYFDYGGASAVSTTPAYVGPVYVWRNVYNRARMYITDPWGNERDRLYMFKSGGLSFNGGRRYLYHNTSMQPPFSSESAASGPNPLGAGFGAGGNGGVNAMQNTVTRNNVFEIWKSNWDTFDLNGASGNDLDYDLSNGVIAEAHADKATPQYQAGNGWSAYWTGKYRLAPGTAGYNDGVVIPNFNDGFVGAAPDRGAHEDGTPDMDFGTTASGS